MCTLSESSDKFMDKIKWSRYVRVESTNPKVPATSVQVICDDMVDAHLASPKSDS